MCYSSVSDGSYFCPLQLGNSVGAPLLTGAADPAFDWPQTAEARATLLRFSAQQLEDDVRAVSAAFTKALGEAGESLRLVNAPSRVTPQLWRNYGTPLRPLPPSG